jgi:protein-S-isoprenylcysteine O-methyltransferase Ste14
MDLAADISWWTFVAVWAIGAFVNRPTRWTPPHTAMMVHWAILCAAITLYFPAMQHGFLGARFLPDRKWLDWTSDGMHVAGFWFAIWARFYIGRSWSAGIALKEKHELARGGPYALVRHPIYSGLLLVCFGKMLGQGKLGSLLAFTVLLCEWKRKSLVEERLMVRQFGDSYQRYRAEVKALIPGIW